ncbi:GTP-binding protein [Frankia sp. CNm7]|uniref:GTP-binding protein n=1 Tax=Frankia nepalensis TaxID=1836974 RepID=A0A937RGR6_9ACTN|nr:GTP-binding protein [Frankia nepalensis]MBL7495626.1 GTP-binding protein [Frankia nepalensis]MBL7508872.1 GTP-binding protein [Frankia nepalensis]MBL7520320.1 GTP-binding protein [Frankia nepalensis]MBL7630095.1 GTP-binding protein [Frankia nepalensis]
MSVRVPVIALTGYLGAGKTTVLNRLLQTPGARLGVVVNDFGAINVDAALVTGQVDQPASIAGGCLCCLPDTDGLDQALEKLSHPRLRLDAVIVEASGVADPPALARLIRFSAVNRVRPGGLVDVIDAASYFDTVDRGGLPPARFASASLVLINKTDRVPPARRAETVARISSRVRASNPHAHIVDTTHGRIDPALVFDAANPHDPVDELPLAALARHDHDDEPHPRVSAVTVPAAGPIDPGPLVDLIENPPADVYRLKGTVTVETGRGPRGHVVNIVGRQVHVASRPVTEGPAGLVAIGMHLDEPTVRARLEAALQPCSGRPAADGVRRLSRLRRLSG